MAQVSPTVPGTSALDVNPELGVIGGIVQAAGLMSVSGVQIPNRLDCKLGIFRFTSVSDADTWDSASARKPPRNLVAVAWQGNDVGADHAVPTITARGAAASVRFDTAAGGRAGWLWVLYRS